jgi:AAA domain/RNase_H superfamily
LTQSLSPDGRRGFYRLPAPDAGDMFFDMEGNPLEPGGLEYLFGVGYAENGAWTFRPFWGHDRAEERVAFEHFMDFVVERRRRFPAAHVYHYASYEATALKRLASLHATREVEVDDFLRHGVLIDLYKAVREALRVSESSYSTKYVERFYRPEREGDVQTAGASIVYYERWRETQDGQFLADIESYNRDDVESTQQLRDWLLTNRPAGLAWRAAEGVPEEQAEQRPSAVRQIEARLAHYRERMVDPLPPDRPQWQPQQHAIELAHQLLDFHRRAAEPAWWAHYERMDLSEEDLMEDAECLAGLTLDLAHPPVPVKRSTRYTYIAPEQETKLATGDDVTRCDTGQSIGKIVFDEASRHVQLTLGPSKEPLPPRLAIGPTGPLDAKRMTEALYRFADSLLAGDDRYAALMQLLQRDPPGLAGRAAGQPIVMPAPDLVPGCVAAVRALDRSYLYVQGPPGAGKTFTGSRLIAALLADGQRVGVMSNSHKAINHLMTGAIEQALSQGVGVRAVKKATQGREDTELHVKGTLVDNVNDNKDVWAISGNLVGGTAWLFSDEAADQRFDVLFIDEAGQVALANLVAAGTCAKNLVLLGDQMQLGQPIEGVHPGRSGDSALDYLLDGAATIAADRGVLLATTWRMHPAVCRFISEAVYDGRLEPESANARRSLVLAAEAHPLLKPAGIVHAGIAHEGCSQRSEEEAALVAELYESALSQRHMDNRGAEHAVTCANILVVAPYNVQVNLLKQVLPEGARVGTVDKFQGQEAEIVIVSMTTSSEQDLPRHIEFLCSKNRLNVAVSRAKCLAIVVANPALMAIKCSTAEQMALVNTLCWVAEAGKT